jgi:hypothetical protein
MNDRRRIVAHVFFDIPPTNGMSLEAAQAALRSAIQVGLNAQVLDIKISELDADTAVSSPGTTPPNSSPSALEQVVEEYSHCGMIVKIYRDAGRRSPPTYFAIVLNPAVKNATGGLITAKSYAQLKRAAEARAERKEFLWKKRMLLV